MLKENNIKCHPEALAEGSMDSSRSFRMTQDEQTGRSMVEMLGVLAVIGVLSVAGIAGYTTAMRSYRTNEVLNAASMLYVMAMAQNAGNGATGDVTYASINNGNNPSGVSSITYTNGSISIAFNTKEDCDAAKAKLGDKAGECPPTATDSAYPLIVTLGDASEPAVVCSGLDASECATTEGCKLVKSASSTGCAATLSEASAICKTFSSDIGCADSYDDAYDCGARFACTCSGDYYCG